MTCKDCIHEIVCGQDEVFKYGAYECTEFKNKADFVEVVRCENCKYWIYWADEKRCSCELHHIRTHRDDFCGYGERKSVTDTNVGGK